MTEARRAHAWTIRALFVLALVVLFLPSRLMALAHGAGVARFAGASISTLLVWSFLISTSSRAATSARTKRVCQDEFRRLSTQPGANCVRSTEMDARIDPRLDHFVDALAEGLPSPRDGGIAQRIEDRHR
jgi:hypothetical protein